jgi:homoserine kinase
MESVIVQVPATTANLGPGFDCLGVALQIHNRITVARSPAPAQNAREMVDSAAADFFRAAQIAPIAFSVQISGDVPRSRGLGSSVTVRLGMLHGLNLLTSQALPAERLFELCAALEGHPDNAAPAAFGGFTVAGGKKVARFEVEPELKFILLIPGFEIATPDARKVLPHQLDRRAAVQSCANACRITAAFASRDYELLRGAFSDGLHQPFREPLVPFLRRVIDAGESAGALGGFLSGSGSTIACVSFEKNAAAVAEAMRQTAPDGCTTLITAADNHGVRILA